MSDESKEEQKNASLLLEGLIKTPEERNASQKRLDALKKLSPDAFAVWKHYEERADHLGEQLWSMGAWLIALLGATLSLPFVGKLVTPISSRPSAAP